MPGHASTAVELHTVVHGALDRPAVALLHPLGTDHRVWAPQLPALTDQLTVITPDLRGHGASPAPPGPYTIAELGTDLLASLDRLEVPRVHLVGTSLGAMVALWVAAHAPDRVDRLVACSGSAFLASEDAWRDRAQIVRSNGTMAIVDGAVHRWFGDGRQPDDAVLERLVARFVGTSDEGYASCCEALGAMDLRDDVTQIVAPTLVVVGARDQAIPPTHATELAERIGNVRLVAVADAGHLIGIDQPATLNALLREHLQLDDRPPA